MKILSIGNSFSEDAQRYLKLIAGANGRELTCVNLYIGGCSLKRHYINLIDNEKSYHYQFGGENTGLMVSIKEVLGSNNWDFITLQQASHESTDIANFIPFLPEIADWLRLRCEGAKILLHQTWAYSEHMERLSQLGFKTTDEMFEKVKSAYESAEKLIKPDGVIKSGEAMLKAYKLNREGTYRDPIHASLGFGRYLLGCVWYKFLFSESPRVHVDPAYLDEPVSGKETELIESILF